MAKILVKDGTIINENRIFHGSLLIEGEKISAVYENDIPEGLIESCGIIDAKGLHIFPGIIDTHVHFREPGLTHKADIYSESKAAVAGGVTSFMDMPNTLPPITTLELLEQKYKLASKKSLANYSFYLGATNNNLHEILAVNPAEVCGIKVFLGSSTGNMLTDDEKILAALFEQSPALLVIHAEDEGIIRQNTEFFRKLFGDNIPVEYHPKIRNDEACFKSSSFAVILAGKYGSRIHLAHLSTKSELELLDKDVLLADKKITSEVCVNHLVFDDTDYHCLGAKIKCNPAIKTVQDKNALLAGLISGSIDSVATDHAPHTIEEKKLDYFKCPSGIPMVQHGFVSMLELYHEGKITLEKITDKLCHAPAVIYRIAGRGFIRRGYKADIVMVDLNKSWKVENTNILSKCGWSPFEGRSFRSQVITTFVNGHKVYSNGRFDESKKGQRIKFIK
jgi:dihydroorotase